MPGYVSHTIMARDVYHHINNKLVDLDSMLTYSLGGDLSKFSKCRYNTHHIDKDKFIYSMCDYIIKNNLVNDGYALSCLYGHICHMVMDDIMHPLVKKITKLCVLNKRNHFFVEEYFDKYLVRYKYKLDIDKYDNCEIFKGNFGNVISKMIDSVYMSVYGVKHLSFYYKFNIFLYKKIRYLYMIFGVKLLNKFSKFNKFLDLNLKVDFLNANKLIFYNNWLGIKCNDDFNTLYVDSVINACLYIDRVNKYIEENSKYY